MALDPQAYSGYGAHGGHFCNVTAPSMFFNHKSEKIDWRRIAAVDMSHITKDLDFSSLQDTITSIAFCDIEHELDSKYIDPNYIRLFKLAQLQIQYLLYSQDYLTGSLSSETERSQAALDELDKVRRELSTLRERQVTLKKVCHRYKKMLRLQQMLMPSTHDLHHPCPHCDKSFIRRDFLVSHVEKRHPGVQLHVQSAGPAVNVSLGSNTRETEELREQLHIKGTEIELLRQQISQGGNIDLSTLRNELMEKHKIEIDALKGMFMDELKDVNARYMASEKALQEVRAKQNQGSRSNLGDLEDDDDVVRMRQQQMQHDAKLEEENRKLKANIAREKAISEKRKKDFERQRAEYENRMMEARESTPKQRRLAEDVNQRPASVEEVVQKRATAPAAAGPSNREDKKARDAAAPAQPPVTFARRFQPEESDEEETEDESESILVSKEMKKTLADTGPMGSGELSATTSWDISQLRSSRVMEKLKAEPSLLQGFITELRNILEERLMELGVDRHAKRLTTPVLNEKLAILRKERDQLNRKHARFASIRQQYVREVEKEAQEKLRSEMPAPAPSAGRIRSLPAAASHTPSPGVQRKFSGPRPPPRPSPQSERRSATLPSMTSAGGDVNHRVQPSAPQYQASVPPLQRKDLDETSSESETDESYSALENHRKGQAPLSARENEARPAPTSNNGHIDSDVRPSPRKPRQHRPLSASNGVNKLDSPESLTEWDTTDGRRLTAPAIPSGHPASGDIVMPRAVKKEEDSESDDWDDSETDELQQLENELAGDTTGSVGGRAGGGGRVAYLSQSLEKQMKRPRDGPPQAGAVDIIPTGSSGDLGRRVRDIDDDDPLADILDDEDDAFDVSSLNGEDSRPPSRKVSSNGIERGLFGGSAARASVGSSGGAGAQTTSPSGQLRLSAAGTDLSNTFGTSQWGTTSKVVSTVNPGATQKSMATNKSSDVGADDFDSD